LPRFALYQQRPLAGKDDELPGRVIAIESALDGWVRVMMRQSVAVADVRGLTVRVLARDASTYFRFDGCLISFYLRLTLRS
jgi:hypothetical protein